VGNSLTQAGVLLAHSKSSPASCVTSPMQQRDASRCPARSFELVGPIAREFKRICLRPLPARP
jgi:hypothetical protein